MSNGNDDKNAVFSLLGVPQHSHAVLGQPVMIMCELHVNSHYHFPSLGNSYVEFPAINNNGRAYVSLHLGSEIFPLYRGPFVCISIMYLRVCSQNGEIL